MNFKQPKLNTNFWIIVGALTFLIFCYFIYLEYYVVAKESKIISTRFRVLDQLGDNINAKIESYTKNALQLEKKIVRDALNIKEYLSTYGHEFTTDQIVQHLYETSFKYGQSEYLNKDLELVDFKIDYGGDDVNKDSVDRMNDVFDRTETDTYYYFPPFLIEIPGEDEDGQVVFLDSVLIRTKYENLVKGLTREDVFDGMFMIRNEEIIFSTLKSDLLIDKSGKNQGQIDLSKAKNGFSKLRQNEGLNNTGPKSTLPGRIMSGEYSDITISNISYKLFFKPVKVEGEYWYLGGLMEARHFNAAGKSISPWVIIILSLILILILLGLPLVKLKVISKSEHLETGTIISSALSILFGASVLTLFLLYLSQNTSHIQNTDNSLMELSTAIDSSLTEEIDSAFAQLQKFDRNYIEMVSDSLKTKSGKPIFDEILSRPEDSLGFPVSYPFADYIFWINKNGVQSAYFTHFVDENGEMTDLGHRDYFKYKDEWFFPADTSRKFRLQSILSITSGNNKAALSTAASDTNNPVIALSSRFYSLIDPIIPKNFGYCIIDQSGKVWFHSNKERNLMENFIHECNDDKGLKAAIYNRTSKSISTNYYNDPHRVYIQPLRHLPLYLVTFYNRDNETSFQAQVFTIVLILICTFFLFIFLQVTILLLLERQHQWNLTKNLIMKITRPMVHLVNHYKFLIWIYLIVAAATAIVLSFMGRPQSFAMVYMVEVIIFVFSYRVLNDNELKVGQKRWFTRINLVILILMNVGLFALIDIEIIWMLVYQLLLILFLELAYRSFKRKVKLPNHSINKVFIRSYVMYLLLMSVIFAVLPTMTFYKIAYNTESEIRLRHYQVDLMKKRESRNNSLNKFYASIIKSEVPTGILQDRKEKGIYTSFLNGLTFSHKPFPPGEMEKDECQHSFFDLQLVLLRPFYDDEIVENKYLVNNDQKNSHKYWINKPGDSLVLRYLSQADHPKSAQIQYGRISAKEEKLNFWMPYHGKVFSGVKGVVYNLVFWLLMLFVLYVFYHLIRFGIRNIYSLDILSNYSQEAFAKLIRHQTLANKDIFVVKLSPKDDTGSLLESVNIDLPLNWSDKNVISTSADEINNCLAGRKSTQINEDRIIAEPGDAKAGKSNKNLFVTIFIDHFEWGYTDPEILNEKLEVLWAFFNHKDIRLIIQSAVHPTKIVDYYRDIIDIRKKAVDGSKTADVADLILLKNLLDSLQQLISNSIINQLPVKCNYSREEEESQCAKPRIKLTALGVLQEEINASDYLLQFKGALQAYFESYIEGRDLENPEELIVVKVNSLADNYYEDLFNSCSAEEQYVMFDLAEDMIVNQKNSKAIFGLLEKGIIIKKCDKLNFMNVSFRRFIYSRLNKADTSALEIQIGKESGTWQGYRTTLILIILGLFIFIAMANQDFMENLNQVFILIGGGVAVITGILGLLSRMSKSVSD